MRRREYFILAGILLFAAVNLFWGISSGIPSKERLEIELGGVETVEAHLPEITAFLQNETIFRSDARQSSSEQSRLSPFFDLLRSYHSDEQFTLKTINAMVSRRTLEPGLYTYGQFYHYQIAAAFAAGAATGYLPLKLDSIGGMKNPDLTGRLYRSGRILLALMGLGGIVLLFFSARILSGNNATALAAAALLAVFPYYAMTAKVIKTEIPACFWSLAVLFFAALAYRDGKLKHYLLAGVMLGLAVGSKYTCVFGSLLIVGFFLARNWSKAFPVRQETRREFLALCGAGAASFLTFSVVCFSWITDHATFMADIAGTTGLTSTRNRFLGFLDYLGCFTFDGFFFHTGPLLIFLFIVAILFAVLKPKRETWPLLPVIFLYFLLAAGSNVPSSDRYTLPALPLLCLLSAFALTQIKNEKIRYILLGGVLVTSAWYSIAIDLAASRKNIRLTATQEIQTLIPPGTAVGRPNYPVSYRTAMLPFGKYREYNAVEHPAKMAECNYFIDCSYAYNTEEDYHLHRRINWLLGRTNPHPHIPTTFPASDTIRLFNAGTPWTLGKLIPGPRFFTMDSYLEAIYPEIVLYTNLP